MGNRVKGRVKKKSIKAAISSTVGSKRKLSRFGKKQKKDHRGLEASFISRSRCLKLLQISIKDFRRLCILKGVYPRNPLKNKFPHKKKGQSFYHIKDVRSIAHEPILDKFREFKAFMKKVRKASGRNELDEANRRHTLLPKYTLHHVVKERYPRFVDALADLDDCLTLTYLYATLPAGGDDSRQHPTPAANFISKAKKLAASWGAYCATTSAITKSFISVKGIYMEATIQSTTIRWIVPHAFTQYIPDDVDFRVMNTFFELYQVMLDFILYKLYNDIGVRYPLSTVVGAGNTSTSVTTTGQGGGTTGAIVGSHLRALRNALDNNTSGGVISSVVSQSQQQVAVSTSATTASQDQDESATKGTKRKNDIDREVTKSRIESVSDALKQLSDSEQDEDDNGDEDVLDDDDDDEDDERVDIKGPLKAAFNSVSDEENKMAFGNDINGSEEDADDTIQQRKRLFHGFTFFMSREIPRGYIELVCLAYGAKAVGWETVGSSNKGDSNSSSTSPISIRDPSITHHIIDRPTIPADYHKLPKSREFIQPQWIIDCANFLVLLPIHKYKIGVTLPPHLSPWVNNNEEGYKPEYAEYIERIKNGVDVDETDDIEVDEDDVDIVVKDEKNQLGDVEEEILEEDEDEEENDEASDEDVKNLKRKDREAEAETEEHKLAKSMMSRKATHLYNRMQYGLAQKKAKVDKLQERRIEIDKKKKDDAKGSTANKTKPVIVIKDARTSDDDDSDDERISTDLKIDKEFLNSGKKAWKVDIIKGKEKDSGKTVLKQKVERLKNERKTIEKNYNQVGSGTGSMKKKRS